jgi:anti-sigma factor (TIGR02949 family)
MKKKTAHCPDVLKHICEELDTKLTTAQCRELKQHLAKCPNCTAYLDSLKKTIKLYSTAPAKHPPQKLRKQLFATLKLKS